LIRKTIKKFFPSIIALGNDDAVLALIAGAVGFLAGKSKTANFEPIINQFNRRLEALRYFQILPPYGFLENKENPRILFREGIYCYLFGLPNSSLPTLVRILEIALNEKYENVEGKKPTPDVSLNGLLDWAEKKLNLDTMTAHSYRKIRNLIHTNKLVVEQDCLEALRHLSNILNEIFPIIPEYVLHSQCPNCKCSVQSRHPTKDLFFGTMLTINKCPSCYLNYQWTVVSI